MKWIFENHQGRQEYYSKDVIEKIKKIAEDTLKLARQYNTYFNRDNKSIKQEGFKGLQKILELIEKENK